MERQASQGDMVRIPGGSFRMGSDDHYPEEAPAHQVQVDEFWIDRGPVTNADFARFVEATAYLSFAERAPDPALYPSARPELLVPGSLLFVQPPGPVDLRDPSAWWTYAPGACWHRPAGPGSSIDELMDHPVVHLTHGDAKAYAAWAGKALPTEAQWERAARGGLEGAAFAWGDEHEPGGRRMANHWRGEFPWQRLGEEGGGGTSAVGAFPPNGFGLYDMIGNVWEWTDDWYRPRHQAEAGSACCVPKNPRGGEEAASVDPTEPGIPIPRKVLKGGSHLCADNFCQRYRPAARYPQAIDTSASHIGFRCVLGEEGAAGRQVVGSAPSGL